MSKLKEPTERIDELRDALSDMLDVFLNMPTWATPDSDSTSRTLRQQAVNTYGRCLKVWAGEAARLRELQK